MILTSKQLRELYEAVVKPFGHPDPLGYMTRALLESGGDPDYIDVSGKRGFMPVFPEVALEMTGATEIQSLESNVVATLTIDRMNFEDFRGIDNMIIAFHYGGEAVDSPRTSQQKEFINDVNESREDVNTLMYPPHAKVADVIKVLDTSKIDIRLTTGQQDFFKFLAGIK